ncbi:UPF0160 protein MYG1, mitochondrial [Strongyloides ratti]|uniref:UPF0160 protein MYG1, mitochondrial n=1 Tax=Strongyloides ratti TaxID=34506 RepID=A0A090L036_STRRB|nr:UPF0160 protein MYG1, mitochondrial [Strongyloides ratti]CEF63041.1 UPF0160 protein MYG1, mitochondrial [Strongyloides ratti]
MSTVTIGTHDGKFHTDEAFACFLLKCLPEYKDAQIIRSRNQEKLDCCTIVVDVGGIFSHEKLRYDHHQRTFNETMASLNILPNFNTKLSSAGLIYAFYGKRAIASILSIPESHEHIPLLYNKMYEHFVENVDAVDNGIAQCDCKKSEKRYSKAESLDSRVSDLMPYWNDPNQNTDERFLKAVNLTGESFTNKLSFYFKAWLPAREIVRSVINNRCDFHESGKIILLPDCGLPWKSHLLEIEKELDLTNDEILFAIFKDSQGNGYRVSTIPLHDDGSFDFRLGLHDKWRGLRDDELVATSGIPTAYFVHMNGFIGGARTLEDAKEMALKSMESVGCVIKRSKRVKRDD